MRANPLRQPVFILGCNRSGTTLLFQNLSQHPHAWSLYIEGQDHFYRHYPQDDTLGDRLVNPPAPTVRDALAAGLYRAAHNKERFKDTPLLAAIPRKAFQRAWSWLYKPRTLRLVEKTPANTLRIPFLAAAFPDARFVFLARRGEDVVSSLMEGWKLWSRPTIGDGPWRYTRWHYLAPPGWQAWRDRPLEEICAFQYVESNRLALDDLAALPPERYRIVRHEELLAAPAEGYAALLGFLELPPSPYLSQLVLSSGERVFTTGGSAPKPDKWKTLHPREIERIQPLLAPIHARLDGALPAAANRVI